MAALTICFGTQKGGGGKSVLTTFFANDLAYEKKKNICIVDLDWQQSIYNIRKIEDSEGLINESHYDIIPCLLKDFPQLHKEIIEKYDVIFLDLPGTIAQEYVLSTYLFVDVIIVPTKLSKHDLISTASFINTIKETVIKERAKLNLQTTFFGIITNTPSNDNDSNVLLDELENNVENALGIPFYNRPLHRLKVFEHIITHKAYKHPKWTYYFKLITKELSELLNIK